MITRAIYRIIHHSEINTAVQFYVCLIFEKSTDLNNIRCNNILKGRFSLPLFSVELLRF